MAAPKNKTQRVQTVPVPMNDLVIVIKMASMTRKRTEEQEAALTAVKKRAGIYAQIGH